ncbi:hypothetical protein [Methanimicrococcus hongohii]|nr:hypothetical protein [Methanimicrococcus sp. Hf6]
MLRNFLRFASKYSCETKDAGYAAVAGRRARTAPFLLCFSNSSVVFILF